MTVKDLALRLFRVLPPVAKRVFLSLLTSPVFRASARLFLADSAKGGFLSPIGNLSVPREANRYRRTSFSQQGEDLLVDRVIQFGLQNPKMLCKRYVDIGSNHPIDNSVTYALYLRGWSGVAFDPSPKFASKLAK